MARQRWARPRRRTGLGSQAAARRSHRHRDHTGDPSRSPIRQRTGLGSQHPSPLRTTVSDGSLASTRAGAPPSAPPSRSLPCGARSPGSTGLRPSTGSRAGSVSAANEPDPSGSPRFVRAPQDHPTPTAAGAGGPFARRSRTPWLPRSARRSPAPPSSPSRRPPRHDRPPRSDTAPSHRPSRRDSRLSSRSGSAR